MKIKYKYRDVAQLGSAPCSGRGGRRFESCHPDFFYIYPNVQITGFEHLYLYFLFSSYPRSRSDYAQKVLSSRFFYIYLNAQITGFEHLYLYFRAIFALARITLKKSCHPDFIYLPPIKILLYRP